MRLTPRLPSRLRLPAGFIPRLPVPPRLPLAITLTGTIGLLLVPAALLLLTPRRSASGLERLMPVAALLQSFPVQRGVAAPALWRQRLGAAPAERAWSAQRRLWWQFWGAHGDAGAYLVLEASPSQPLPANALRLDDLLVVAPDPLARQLLQDQLRVRRRAPRGLALRCTEALQQRQAVHWNAAALGRLLGPLAPLSQDLHQGCLVLAGEGRELRWQGEADASEGTQATAPPPLDAVVASPLQAGEWLDLRGRQLDLLLRGPLASPILRQALAGTYGLGPDTLQTLRSAPFQLRLRPVERGAFLAGLELQIAAGDRRSQLESWLRVLAGALQEQGLSEGVPREGVTTWSREDGTLVGGWRWLPGRQELLLFLGPVPTRLPASPSLGSEDWRLRVRPDAIASSGLLPADLPPVVRRASQLEIRGRPLGSRAGERQTSLAGRLALP